MAKLIINLIAHDGITSLYTGVGRIAQDSLNILCQKSIPFADYNVNAITGKYNQRCLGFDERIKNATKRKLATTGGRLYECSNGSAGDVSYGDMNNWKTASSSVAAIVKNIAKNNHEALCINLCLDTPFANVAGHYYSRYEKDNNIFIWIPHSTVLIHEIDSAITFYPDYSKKRFEWEKKSVDFVNARERVYLGCIGKFMKRHLIKDYGADAVKLIDFTDGLDILSPRYRRRVSQEEIKRSLKKIHTY